MKTNFPKGKAVNSRSSAPPFFSQERPRGVFSEGNSEAPFFALTAHHTTIMKEDDPADQTASWDEGMIRRIQRQLRKMNHYTGGTTGKLDEQTVASLNAAYQNYNWRAQSDSEIHRQVRQAAYGRGNLPQGNAGSTSATGPATPATPVTPAAPTTPATDAVVGSASAPTAPASATTEPASFRQSGYDQTTPPLLHPWSSPMEDELSQLSSFAVVWGYGQSRSQLIDLPTTPGQEDLKTNLEARIAAFVQRFLIQGTDVDRTRMELLLREYLKGYAAAQPEHPDIADFVERQHGGYDAMAALLAQHSGSQAGDQEWALSESESLMQLLHDMGYWQDLERRVAAAAEGEYTAWTDEDDPQGRQRAETDSDNSDANLERLTAYWRATGRSERRSVSAARSSARDTHGSAYWSAAFISYVMQQAGAADTFAYDDAHSRYGVAARDNESDNRSAVTHPSRLLDADTEPIHVGSLVHRNRVNDANRRISSAENLRSGDPSHADLVVAIEIYTADGTRVPGDYETIIDDTPQETLDTYQIFAVTIGGNARDHSLGLTNGVRTPNQRSLAGRNTSNRETVGRDYYPLNSDLTIDNSHRGRSKRVYGVQRMSHPPRSDE